MQKLLQCGCRVSRNSSGYDVYDVVARPRLSAKQEEKAGVLQSFTRVSFEMDAATSSKRPTATQSPQTRGREREGEGGSARGRERERERERKRGTERESDLATRTGACARSAAAVMPWKRPLAPLKFSCKQFSYHISAATVSVDKCLEMQLIYCIING